MIVTTIFSELLTHFQPDLVWWQDIFINLCVLWEDWIIIVMAWWSVEQDSDPGSGVGQKWRPQQAYGSNQVLLAQPQTIFSTPKILTLMHR